MSHDPKEKQGKAVEALGGILDRLLLDTEKELEAAVWEKDEDKKSILDDIKERAEEAKDIIQYLKQPESNEPEPKDSQRRAFSLIARLHWVWSSLEDSPEFSEWVRGEEVAPRGDKKAWQLNAFLIEQHTESVKYEANSSNDVIAFVKEVNNLTNLLRLGVDFAVDWQHPAGLVIILAEN